MTINKRKLLLGCLTFLIITFGYVVYHNQTIQVDRVDMYHPKLPASFDGFKILQISDLHGAVFGDNQQQLINKIENEQVDIILFTGDYTKDYSHDFTPLEMILKQLPQTIPAYFILGHSDIDAIPELVEGNTYYDLFTSYGVDSLYPGLHLTRGEDEIFLTKDYYAEYYTPLEELQSRYANWKLSSSPADVDLLEKSEQYAYFERQFTSLYKEADDPFTIQVVHEAIPVSQFDYHLRHMKQMIIKVGYSDSQWINWDLSISGHTHGGQIRLPFLGGLVDETGISLGDKPVGLATSQTRAQYISPGLGTHGPKFLDFRLFNPPTLSIIELHVGAIEENK